jgi:hypothetical protein
MWLYVYVSVICERYRGEVRCVYESVREIGEERRDGCENVEAERHLADHFH